MGKLYRYFSAMPGRVAPRYGTRSFIGAIKTKTGFVVNPEEIVPIALKEIRPNLAAYNRMLKRTPRLGPCLRERTRDEYVSYMQSIDQVPVSDPDQPSSVSASPMAYELKQNPRRNPKKRSEAASSTAAGRDDGGE